MTVFIQNLIVVEFRYNASTPVLTIMIPIRLTNLVKKIIMCMSILPRLDFLSELGNSHKTFIYIF